MIFTTVTKLKKKKSQTPLAMLHGPHFKNHESIVRMHGKIIYTVYATFQ